MYGEESMVRVAVWVAHDVYIYVVVVVVDVVSLGFVLNTQQVDLTTSQQIGHTKDAKV